MPMWISLTLPIRARSGLNNREHWCARAKRVKGERAVVIVLAGAKLRSFARLVLPPYQVLLTRIGPRKLDSDNVAGSLKSVRDEVAAQLGIDDGDDAEATWECAQQKGQYGVLVRIEGATKLERRESEG